MNIVLIKKDIDLFEKTAEVLIECGANVYAIEPPVENSNRYIEEILMIKKEAGVDLLLSFEYFPEISLAAGALNVKYACIVTTPYRKELYDNSVLNPWNYIFTGDAFKVNKLKNLGQKNAFLVPFACTFSKMGEQLPFTKNDENISEELYNVFSGLSQGIQGYLDGFMAVLRQDATKDSVFKHLSVKARTEIEEKIPLNLSNSLETKAEYYDHSFLLPILTGRSISLFKNVVEAECGDFESLVEAGIVVSIPDRNAGTCAAVYEWQAIAEGKLLIASSITDFSILGDFRPVSYSDRFELTRLIKYYLSHEKERKEYALKVKEAALSNNTIETYVGNIIERLTE